MHKQLKILAGALSTTIAASCANSPKLPPSALEVPVPLEKQIVWAPECYLGPEPFNPPERNPEPETPKSNPPTPAERLAWSDWALTEALKDNAEWKRAATDTTIRFQKCRSTAPGITLAPIK